MGFQTRPSVIWLSRNTNVDVVSLESHTYDASHRLLAAIAPFVHLRTVLGNPKCDVSAHARHLVSQKSTDSSPLPFRTMTNRSDRSNTKYSTPSPFFDPNQFNVHPSGR
jgi:hypothetical protein